ncbi:RNA polymerase sigma factor [Chitinophaga sp. HK235]|uniref:RNA polymerase sigma factor n=1 Tax=Chitinophaga sp. HK235 TaxID=2952571 RepID=UPI001BA8700D|nr:hypothetical protein [Chitinophaga sp. HK235]
MTTFSSLSDIEMIALVKADDEQAFAELYKRYWKKLYQTAYDIIQQEQVAQDVVQEVFISLRSSRLTFYTRNDPEISFCLFT